MISFFLVLGTENCLKTLKNFSNDFSAHISIFMIIDDYLIITNDHLIIIDDY